MTETISVLVLEDEPEWARTVESVAAELGWQSQHATTVTAARNALLEQRFDIAVIDRLLGATAGGLALIEELKRLELTVMTLVVSQLSTTSERIAGLDAGADDYLGKPFEPDELRARLVALARRAGKFSPYPTVLLVGDLEVRRSARTVAWRGQSVRLSDKQFDLLWVLASHADQSASKEHIWREVWPEFSRLTPQTNTLEVAVARLRKALKALTGQNCIRSVRSRGYRLDVA